jgi:hypothetical protein
MWSSYFGELGKRTKGRRSQPAEHHSAHSTENNSSSNNNNNNNNNNNKNNNNNNNNNTTHTHTHTHTYTNTHTPMSERTPAKPVYTPSVTATHSDANEEVITPAELLTRLELQKRTLDRVHATIAVQVHQLQVEENAILQQLKLLSRQEQIIILYVPLPCCGQMPRLALTFVSRLLHHQPTMRVHL